MIIALLIIVILVLLFNSYVLFTSVYIPYQDQKFEQEVKKMRERWEKDKKEI